MIIMYTWPVCCTLKHDNGGLFFPFPERFSLWPGQPFANMRQSVAATIEVALYRSNRRQAVLDDEAFSWPLTGH
jgi:hypothetical protein